MDPAQLPESTSATAPTSAGTPLAARSAGTSRISRASRWRCAPAKPTPHTCRRTSFGSLERPDADGALREPRARDFAARDFKRYLKLERGWAPSSVNLALAAIDHFNRFLGLGPAIVTRERLAQSVPRALDEDQQRALLRAAEDAGPRDRAIVVLLLHAGLRLSELVAHAAISASGESERNRSSGAPRHTRRVPSEAPPPRCGRGRPLPQNARCPWQ